MGPFVASFARASAALAAPHPPSILRKIRGVLDPAARAGAGFVPFPAARAAKIAAVFASGCRSCRVSAAVRGVPARGLAGVTRIPAGFGSGPPLRLLLLPLLLGGPLLGSLG